MSPANNVRARLKAAIDQQQGEVDRLRLVATVDFPNAKTQLQVLKDLAARLTDQEALLVADLLAAGLMKGEH